ncbi:hypothetical protein GGS23DRAFT_556856 [Durotheca rogersii]|uniref:uncharacterized protein n=1 Tax=Durotheca rogersii TaxID=419775 RepID=UPI00222049C8|nr:uncharacterized protein GGS23DRAFT_556856 [Durotheca rogersii]KAI5866381.1 hypothetical protein GGS23DRAFT_556856 [Durotheca rogersii]
MVLSETGPPQLSAAAADGAEHEQGVPASAPAPGADEPRKAGGGRAAERGNPLDADFAAFARAALDRWHVPGVAVAVLDGDQIWAEVSHPPYLPTYLPTLFFLSYL